MLIRHWMMAGLMASTLGMAAHAGDDNPADPNSTLMRSMSTTNTFGHPDLYGQLTGLQDYTSGEYRAAMHQFLLGARYADKLSQLSIGLMYLQGQGVTKDPVTALAWISLAAERGYPQFVATRDNLARQLSSRQVAQARQVQATLAATYADAVAKPRMVLAMHEAMQYVNPVGRPPEGAYTYVGPPSSTADQCGIDPDTGKPIRDCSFYAKWRWDPDQYFATEDAQWHAPKLKGTVTVQPLQSAQGNNGPSQ
ncbi:sel1 repeat family protein [Frateuria aurantia]